MNRVQEWWRRWSPWVLGVWLFGYLAFIATQRVDPDFGWHYRSGEYILAHGVPHYDVFTYTARDFAWVNHEWLNDVVMYAVSHAWGYRWLGFLYAGLWTLALPVGAGRRLRWATAGLALGGLLLYVGVRGVTWTALGLALVLAVVRAGRKRYWLLVPLFLVWANVHAGFAIGLAMVALAAAVKRDKRLALWGLAAVPATLVNPYGLCVYVELWRTMSDGKIAGYIVEWAPLAPNYAVMPYVLAVITVLLLARQRRTFDWLRSAGLVLAALWSNRHMPLLVVGTLGVADEGVRAAMVFVRRSVWVVVVFDVTLGVLYPLFLLWQPPALDRGVQLARPTLVLQDLKAAPCQGHVFNDYSYGGLMIWALPGVPDYIDGRMPSWSGPRGRYLDRYVEVLKGGDAMREEFARFNVQCAVLSKLDDKLSTALAQTPGWRLARRAQDAELWRRD
ncbi:MAG TPA: hypothetical protein VI322_02110 [Candidatus Saccharimonadia bacterium]